MNKTQLVAAVAEETGMSKKAAEAAVQATLDTISATLAEKESVALAGFGTFQVKERAARTGRNPQTGEEMQIAAATVPSFKAGKALKDSVNA